MNTLWVVDQSGVDKNRLCRLPLNLNLRCARERNPPLVKETLRSHITATSGPKYFSSMWTLGRTSSSPYQFPVKLFNVFVMLSSNSWIVAKACEGLNWGNNETVTVLTFFKHNYVNQLWFGIEDDTEGLESRYVHCMIAQPHKRRKRSWL